ncbi:hypothetical protein Cgig2_015383 [Carnegiea gigantea]|uniref:STAS domain-containing protein n=1 Tax=Carnegiea gigantea TaxID=171969 RepID=A0A9Q1JST8_9CARY|nr:hypothetical protein Cgig2_015383 [Carnegiea gigantea]
MNGVTITVPNTLISLPPKLRVVQTCITLFPSTNFLKIHKNGLSSPHPPPTPNTSMGGLPIDGETETETKDIDMVSMAVSSEHRQHNQNPTLDVHQHKVGVPSKQNLFKEFTSVVKETFFADDPLRHFKDQSSTKKLKLGIQAVFPILDWGRGYNLKKFRGDLIAGITIASLCIPQNEIDPTMNPVEYRRLAFTATFFAGVTQMTLGFLRLGFLIDFLSHAAIVGFMGGAAITIALQQLKGFLGIKHFTKKSDLVSVLHSVFDSAHHGWNWQTIVIGAVFLAFLLFAKFIVNHIDKGLNPSSVHLLYLSGENLLRGFKIGAVAGMIALTEASAIGRTFAALKDYQLDGNKEMVALGAMNVVGSMTSCYVATGSFSRSAVNYMAGCQTAVSNIVMSFIVFLTLLFITPLFKYTPNAILASIIISAVLNLIDYEAAILIWKIDKFDFIACMGAFFGVIFASVEIGLLIAQYPEANKVPGILIVRVDSAIYFSNSNYVKERILRWLVDEEDKRKKEYSPRIQFLIVEMSPVTDIDTSGIHALEELYKSLQKRNVQRYFHLNDLSCLVKPPTTHLALANPGPIVIEKLQASKFTTLIGEDNIYLTVAQAIHACSPKVAEVP